MISKSIFLNELLVLGNINAAKYRQKILEPFFEELLSANCMLMNCRKDTFNRMEKLEEKLKKLITPRTC
jgi:hypothetical protein